MWADPKTARLRNEGAESFSAQVDVDRTIWRILCGPDRGFVRQTEGQDRGDGLGLERGTELLLRHEVKDISRLERFLRMGPERLAYFDFINDWWL